MTMKPKHGEDTGHTFASSSNGEWMVQELKASDSIRSFHVDTDESKLEKFSEVTFTLHLKRKPQFIQIYLMYPCLLLIWVAAITFLLPVSSGEKVGLVSTILLSLFVFLLIVSAKISMPGCCQRLLYSSVAQFFCFSFSKPHVGFNDYQILFRNSANATTEISPPWREKNIKLMCSKQWEQFGQLVDRIFLTVYMLLCLLVSLYIVAAI